MNKCIWYLNLILKHPMNKIMTMLNFTQLYLDGELGKCKQLGVKIQNKEGPIKMIEYDSISM